MYNIHYETKLLRVFLEYPDYLRKYAHIVEPSHFSTPELSLIYSTLRDLSVTKFEKITPDILLTEILSKHSVDQNVISKIISMIYSQPVDNLDPDWVIDKLKTFVRTQKLKQALANSIEIIEKGEDLHKIVWEIDKALSIGADDQFIDSEFLSDRFLDEYKKKYDTNNIIRTGYRALDESMHGGFLPGEVHVIVAPPKTGKSTFAANVGYRVSRLSKRPVIHITLELSELEVSAMYIQIAGQLTHSEILSMTREDFNKRVKPVISQLTGKIFIKKFIPGATTVMHIRSFISKLRSEGYIDNIGLIIIDYDDLLIPSGGQKSMYEDAGAIYVEMFQLANYFKCPVLTLAQPNREAWMRLMNSKELKLIEAFDLAHSAMKTFYASSIFSLNKIPDSDYYILHPSLVRRGAKAQDSYLKGELDVRTFIEIDVDEISVLPENI